MSSSHQFAIMSLHAGQKYYHKVCANYLSHSAILSIDSGKVSLTKILFPHPFVMFLYSYSSFILYNQIGLFSVCSAHGMYNGFHHYLLSPHPLLPLSTHTSSHTTPSHLYPTCPTSHNLNYPTTHLYILPLPEWVSALVLFLTTPKL